jgi:hypothetical protein
MHATPKTKYTEYHHHRVRPRMRRKRVEKGGVRDVAKAIYRCTLIYNKKEYYSIQ